MNQPASPLVSVLVTSYNHAAYVEQALDSVLAQDFTDYELIITDDASTDESADVIRRWLDSTGAVADFAVNERNLGICGSRNRGLARARGELVCGLSADDWFEPYRLGCHAPILAAQPPEVAAVYSDVREVDAAGNRFRDSFLARTRPGPPPTGDLFSLLFPRNFLPAMGVMVRRSALDAVGGYDEALVFEDWDMWLRLADRFDFVYVDGPPVVNRRVLPGSLGSGAGTIPWHHSAALINAKWLDRGDGYSEVAARRLRHAALEVGVVDPDEARRLLALAADVPPHVFTWRMVHAALGLPKGGWAVGVAHDRWLRWRGEI